LIAWMTDCPPVTRSLQGTFGASVAPSQESFRRARAPRALPTLKRFTSVRLLSTCVRIRPARELVPPPPDVFSTYSLVKERRTGFRARREPAGQDRRCTQLHPEPRNPNVLIGFVKPDRLRFAIFFSSRPVGYPPATRSRHDSGRRTRASG
jgi:hypothetical protein